MKNLLVMGLCAFSLNTFANVGVGLIVEETISNDFNDGMGPGTIYAYREAESRAYKALQEQADMLCKEEGKQRGVINQETLNDDFISWDPTAESKYPVLKLAMIGEATCVD